MAPYSSPHHVGSQSLLFDKGREGKMDIAPKDLNVVWGNDSRYWNLSSNDNKVELCQVSWLEVTGSVGETNPDKNYEVGFQLSLNQDAFGWGSSPIYIMVKRGKEGKFAWRKYNLNSMNAMEIFEVTGSLMKADKSVQNLSDRKLYFGMYEVWSGKWKGGLKIHQVSIKESP